MDTKAAIRQAIGILAAHPDSGHEEVLVALERDGIPGPLARSLLEFMPLAFGRTFLDGMGIHFPDYYLRVDDKGQERLRRKLKDEPIYKESLALAPGALAQGQSVFLAVAGRSAELNAVNQALHAGSSPENLVFSPPILNWSEEHAAAAASSPSKRWWQFWK